MRQQINNEEEDIDPHWYLQGLLSKVERLNKRIKILLRHPIYAGEWNRFIKAGGVTSKDFQNYLQQKPMSRKPSKMHKHLRLVTNKGSIKRVERKKVD